MDKRLNNASFHCFEMPVPFNAKNLSILYYFQAEKAEGYINLTDFIIDRALECKKKL